MRIRRFDQKGKLCVRFSVFSMFSMLSQITENPENLENLNRIEKEINIL